MSAEERGAIVSIAFRLKEWHGGPGQIERGGTRRNRLNRLSAEGVARSNGRFLYDPNKDEIAVSIAFLLKEWHEAEISFEELQNLLRVSIAFRLKEWHGASRTRAGSFFGPSVSQSPFG